MTVVETQGGGFRAVDRKAWPLAGTQSRWTTLTPPTAVDLITSGILTNAGTYADLYQTQPWVYTLVGKLANAVARLPLKSYELDSQSGNRVRLRDHPLPMLLEAPSPRSTVFYLLQSIAASVLVYGNALVVTERAGTANPVGLWPVDWRYVTVRAGERDPVESYLYRPPNGKEVVWLPEEVMHFRLLALNNIVGVSPLMPLARTLILEDAAQRHMIATFRNGGRPSGAFVSEQPLRGPDFDRVKAEVQATYGGVDNSGRIALLHGGLDWKSISMNAVDAEVISLRKLNREEVAACYFTDPTQVGILDRATFSNVTEAHRSFYMDTLGPLLAMIESTVDAQMIRSAPAFDGTFVEFDLADVLKGDIETRFAAYMQATGGVAFSTPNEVRRLENLPPVDDRGMDAVWAPMNMVALDGRIPSNSDTPVGTPPLGRNAQAELEAELKRLSDRVDDRLGSAPAAQPVEVRIEEGAIKLEAPITVQAAPPAPPPVVTIAEGAVTIAEGAMKTEVHVEQKQPRKAVAAKLDDGSTEITYSDGDDE